MILDPRIILGEGIIKSESGIHTQQVQPNGIDCTLSSVREKWPEGMFVMTDNDTWVAPPPKDIEKIEGMDDGSGYFEGKSGRAYNLEFREHVTLPKGICALVQGRSTMNRNGLFVRGAVFDSGYNCYVGAVLYSFQNFRIHWGTRIAQIIFMEAGGEGLYQGGYNQPFKGEEYGQGRGDAHT